MIKGNSSATHSNLQMCMGLKTEYQNKGSKNGQN